MMRLMLSLCFFLASTRAFVSTSAGHTNTRCEWEPSKTACRATHAGDATEGNSRRAFLASTTAAATAVAFGEWAILPAQAIGPVKIALKPTKYSAVICPPDRPIPGEKAMVGMKGLCVTVEADMQDSAPKDLEKVGVYGFVSDSESGDSVLANNPDGGTDAGQFAMIESVTTKDKKVIFEFIAAVPRDKDLSQFENGIGPLDFSSLRIISYPGGQQYGAIAPCEMNRKSKKCVTRNEPNIH